MDSQFLKELRRELLLESARYVTVDLPRQFMRKNATSVMNTIRIRKNNDIIYAPSVKETND